MTRFRTIPVVRPPVGRRPEDAPQPGTGQPEDSSYSGKLRRERPRRGGAAPASPPAIGVGIYFIVFRVSLRINDLMIAAVGSVCLPIPSVASAPAVLRLGL